MTPSRSRAVGLLAGAVCLFAVTTARAAATIVIDDDDPAGQGLNDPSPLVAAGGNAATTLGAARLAVFQRAASLWGARLTSRVPIHVGAQFVALSCDSVSAELANSGATTVHRDFTAAPLSSTWYPQALANAIAGTDLDPSTPDIDSEFNGALGGSGCLPGTTWYLGFDGNPGSGQIDLLTVVLHELAHGLGFQTFDDLATGEKLLGLDDGFLRDLREQGASPSALPDMTDSQRISASVSDPNLYWAGGAVQAAASSLSSGLIAGHVRLFAPAPQQPGSSVSHYSVALTPDELMEPSYTGPNHDLRLTVDLLQDVGWTIDSSAPAVPALPAATRWLLASSLAAAAALQLRPRSPSTRGRDASSPFRC